MGLSVRFIVCGCALGQHTWSCMVVLAILSASQMSPTEPSFGARCCTEQLLRTLDYLIYPAAYKTPMSPIYI